MTTGLDKAREQYEAGRYKAAVETLLYLEPQIRGAEDFDGARPSSRSPRRFMSRVAAVFARTASP